MKFSAEKKNSIIMYILERINSDASDISKSVAETFGISRNTVNQYLCELTDKGIIRKLKRNSYSLVSKEYSRSFYRSKGELDSDTYIYDEHFKDIIADFTDEAKTIWYHAMTEMINNVIDHSDADCLDVVVKSNYFSTTVMLLDNGIGIFEKLKRHFNFASLEQARCELFKGKLTTDADNHSGEGIFFTSKMMDTFLIVSDGLVFATDKYDAKVNFSADSPFLDGTNVIMQLSNFTHRKISEVFDLYSSVEDGFAKTLIPMRNMFDSAPVSRSQAKRVCYRLENFKEIVLDFDRLEWMGQAFAHQLFVVYQNSHPDMLLTPINMNDAVSKMYNHVKKTK